MSTPIIIGGEPPKKGKLRRWLATRTGQTVLTVAAVGTSAITNPQVQAGAERLLQGLSEGQSFGWGLVLAAAAAGLARARSA